MSEADNTDGITLAEKVDATQHHESNHNSVRTDSHKANDVCARLEALDTRSRHPDDMDSLDQEHVHEELGCCIEEYAGKHCCRAYSGAKL